MNISEINNSFKNGYIPDSLYWNIEKDRIQIDPRKISYTDYYQSYDFYESKFEGDYSTIIKKIIINQLMDDHEKVNHSTEHFMQLHRRSDGLSSKQLCDLLDHDTLIVP
jgi:Fe-S-cluster formation regulator IscX/YfhJ